jgi:uncharacterized membrane protein
MAVQGGQTPFFGFFKLNFVMYLICVTWLILIIITPMVEPEDSVHFGDEGFGDRVGTDEHYSDIEKLENSFGRIVYHSGDRMCHIKESRSLLINGNQMSYCARDFGIFLGLAVGAGIVTFVVIDLKWYILLIGIIPIGLDGGLQLITSYESNNVLRIFTGGLFGLVTMIAIGLVTVEISLSVRYWMENKIRYNNYQKLNKVSKAKKHKP